MAAAIAASRCPRTPGRGAAARRARSTRGGRRRARARRSRRRRTRRGDRRADRALEVRASLPTASNGSSGGERSLAGEPRLDAPAVSRDESVQIAADAPQDPRCPAPITVRREALRRRRSDWLRRLVTAAVAACGERRRSRDARGADEQPPRSRSPSTHAGYAPYALITYRDGDGPPLPRASAALTAQRPARAGRARPTALADGLAARGKCLAPERQRRLAAGPPAPARRARVVGGIVRAGVTRVVVAGQRVRPGSGRRVPRRSSPTDRRLARRRGRARVPRRHHEAPPAAAGLELAEPRYDVRPFALAERAPAVDAAPEGICIGRWTSGDRLDAMARRWATSDRARRGRGPAASSTGTARSCTRRRRRGGPRRSPSGSAAQSDAARSARSATSPTASSGCIRSADGALGDGHRHAPAHARARRPARSRLAVGAGPGRAARRGGAARRTRSPASARSRSSTACGCSTARWEPSSSTSAPRDGDSIADRARPTSARSSSAEVFDFEATSGRGGRRRRAGRAATRAGTATATGTAGTATATGTGTAA